MQGVMNKLKMEHIQEKYPNPEDIMRLKQEQIKKQMNDVSARAKNK